MCPVRALLPPRSFFGAFSRIPTVTPCSRAASAAHRAALPAPTTSTSYCSSSATTPPHSARPAARARRLEHSSLGRPVANLYVGLYNPPGGVSSQTRPVLPRLSLSTVRGSRRPLRFCRPPVDR